MIEGCCAVGPETIGTSDHALPLGEIDHIDGVDFSAGEASGRGPLASSTVDIAVLACIAAVVGILTVWTDSHAVTGPER